MFKGHPIGMVAFVTSMWDILDLYLYCGPKYIINKDFHHVRKEIYMKDQRSVPGWCGSVDSVPACEPKGHKFDSQTGHMPGLKARSPVGDVQEATTH